MTKQLLFDADFTLFRACSAVEDEVVHTNEAGHKLHILNSDFNEALEAFERDIRRHMANLKGEEAILIFSGDKNFRYDVWAGYKGNRDASRKPLCYWDVIQHLRDEGRYRVLSESCLEGDDYIGILSTRPSANERIIISEDKDMQTLPNVTIWRQGGLVHTTPDSAEEYWLLQTLMGDSTDGYKGCPSIGPKAAETVLQKAGDPWTNVVAAYEAAYKKDKDPEKAKWLDMAPADLALMNARLARILRFTDWDAANRQPILWTPPSA